MKLKQNVLLAVWNDPLLVAQGTAEEVIPILRAILPVEGKATGTAIIVCPGGGYAHLADHEGNPVGEWLSSDGITAFILHYRLGPKYRHPTQLLDAQRAIRLVRTHATEWQLDPARIGILGFSAGGHLASTTATRFQDSNPDAVDPVERASSRPDIQILIYPVISLHITYQPICSLLGGEPHPTAGLLDELSTEQHVTPQTPPAFLAHSTQDTLVPIANSDAYAAQLAATGVPYEFVRDDFGEHGSGLHAIWTQPCIQWLRKLGL
ncbi:alpha/beta hydrolase [Ktedonobacteria bacterium brp13]|nr:alpha/beta hydrolase [Ktedonobacteria bacterium brp13]